MLFMSYILYIKVVSAIQHIIFILYDYLIADDCKGHGTWKGVIGKDVDDLTNNGNNLARHARKTLTECKALCVSTVLCNSIHYHPWKNEEFGNCHLNDAIFDNQSQISHDGGDWTTYWLDCNPGIIF